MCVLFYSQLISFYLYIYFHIYLFCLVFIYSCIHFHTYLFFHINVFLCLFIPVFISTFIYSCIYAFFFYLCHVLSSIHVCIKVQIHSKSHHLWLGFHCFKSGEIVPTTFSNKVTAMITLQCYIC